MAGELQANTLALTKPNDDIEVMSFYSEALKLQSRAEERIILEVEDIKTATDDLAIIARLKKAMEERRKVYLSPFQQHVKEVNEAYRILMEPIEIADTITQRKIKDYVAEQKRIRAEQERINQLRMEAARAEAALKEGEITESVNLVEVQTETPKHFRSDAGMLGSVDHWKVEVIDFQALPDEYKIPDQMKLNRVVRAGLHTIPGCNIWNDPDLRMTLK